MDNSYPDYVIITPKGEICFTADVITTPNIMEVCEFTVSIGYLLRAVSGFPEKGIICFELEEDLLTVSHLIDGAEVKKTSLNVYSIRYQYGEHIH